MNISNRKILTKAISGILSSLPIIGLTGTVLAQDFTLEEVVITAQHREQNLQDVGVAVTAFSGESLSGLGVVDSEAIALHTPGLQVSNTAGYGSKMNFVMRGVGLNDYSDHQESGVAMYQDGVYISSLNGSVFALFDIERAEVLRGPQGTLFGRSATGGLVNFYSKKPSDELEGYVKSGVGSYNEFTLEGAVGGALVEDTLLGRFAVQTKRSDGWLENKLPDGPKDAYDVNSYAVRGQLQYLGGDDFDALLQVEYGRSNPDAGAVFVRAESSSDPVTGDHFRTSSPSDDELHEGNSNFESHLDLERTFVSLTMNWAVGEYDLTSTTAYINSDKDRNEDTDMGPTSFLTTGNVTDADEILQEFRLYRDFGPMRLTSGLFMFNYQVKSLFPVDLLDGVAPWDNFTDMEKDSQALYAQLEFDLSDDFTLIGGLRASHEEVDMEYVQIYKTANVEGIIGAPLVFTEENFGPLTKLDEEYYSGNLQLNWLKSEDTLVYLSYRLGIKPGSFNAPLVAIPVEDMQFKEEQLSAYEFGVKSDFYDGRARLNLSLWYYDYKDYQGTQFKSVATFVTNSDAKLYGLDADLFWLPTDSWQVTAGLALLKGTVEDVGFSSPSEGEITRDRDMPNAPELSFNGAIAYEWEALNGTMKADVDWSYNSETFSELQNHSLGLRGSYSVFGAGLSWASADENTQVRLKVTNIGNRKYEAYVVDITDFGLTQILPGKPLYATLSATYSW